MSETMGLVIFGILLAVMAILLVDYSRRRERIETDAAFAQERGWSYKEILPGLGQSQRQRVFAPIDPEPLPWKMTISLPQSSSSTSVPAMSTVWYTTQVRSRYGTCIIGPVLPQPMEKLDLSSPIVTGLLRLFLGSDAQPLTELQVASLPDTVKLTILSTDPEHILEIIKNDVIDWYDDWLNRFPEEDCFPIMIFDEHKLRVKTRKALTKASEADAFVRFCTGLVQFGIE